MTTMMNTMMIIILYENNIVSTLFDVILYNTLAI